MPDDDLPLAGMGRELVQQLEVGEAETDSIDLDYDLVRAGLRHVLAAVEHESPGSDQLDGVLGGRESVVAFVWSHRARLAWSYVTGGPLCDGCLRVQMRS